MQSELPVQPYDENSSFLDELLDDPALADQQNLALAGNVEESDDESEEEIEENTENFDDEPHYDSQGDKPRKKRLSQSDRQKKRLQEMQAQMLEMQAQLEKERQIKMSYEEELFKSKLDTLEKDEKYWKTVAQDYKSSLESSYEEGASAAMADYTEKLHDSKINLRQIQEEKNKIHNLYSQYKNNPTPAPRSVTVVDEGLNRFLEKHPYLDPDKNNPNYSPDAFAEVSKLSSELSKQYKIQGRGNDISSDDYYEDLEKMMKKNSTLTPQRKSSSDSSSTPRSVRMVAPVGKRQTITHDDPEVAFSTSDKVKMNTLRNLFGKDYDDLLVKTFSDSKRRKY